MRRRARAFDHGTGREPGMGQALKILAGKAGIYGMIGGQVVDVEEYRTASVPGRCWILSID